MSWWFRVEPPTHDPEPGPEKFPPQSRGSPSPRASTDANVQPGRSKWFVSVTFSSSYVVAWPNGSISCSSVASW